MQLDTKRILHLFPALESLSSTAQTALWTEGLLAHEPSGKLMDKVESRCPFVPLILSGSLRVFKLSPEGREITLFRARAGDCCLLGLACRMGQDGFPAMVQVDEDAEMFLIPSALYERTLENHPAWCRFLLETLYLRLSESLSVLEALTFTRVDQRLALYLLQQSDGKPITLHLTHERIAAELNTAREVISRLLGHLKARGIVELSRGQIRIVNIRALKEFSE